MELLVFAHRGEAQEFIKRLGMRPVEGNSQLYQGPGKLLLLSGEGIYEVFTRLGPALGQFPVKSVINLGIAGSLSPQVEVGQIHSIRSVYAYNETPLFHSYTLADPEAKFDNITSSQRALSEEIAEKLSCFAPVVDRELWAIAKLCAHLNLPLRSYKLISDVAGPETACFDLKQRALEFSTQLLERYLDLVGAPSPSKESPAQNASRSPELPMSFTQKARFQKALEAAKNIPEFDEDAFYEDQRALLDNEKLSPKQKANLLVEELELLLNPIKKRTKLEFDRLSSPLKRAGAKVVFDKHFEKKKFQISMEINSQKNIDALRDGLEAVRFERFEAAWSGVWEDRENV